MLMNLILIVLLLGFVGAGAKDGFVHTLGRLIGSVIAFELARKYALNIAGFVGIFVPIAWARIASFIIVFVVVTRLVGFLVKLLDGAFSIISIIPFLKSINKLLGGIIGIGEGIVVIGGVIFLILNFNVDASLMKSLAASGVAQWLLGTFHLLLGALL